MKEGKMDKKNKTKKQKEGTYIVGHKG